MKLSLREQGAKLAIDACVVVSRVEDAWRAFAEWSTGLRLRALWWLLFALWPGKRT